MAFRVETKQHGCIHEDPCRHVFRVTARQLEAGRVLVASGGCGEPVTWIGSIGEEPLGVLKARKHDAPHPRGEGRYDPPPTEEDPAMKLADVMAALEKAGSPQFRKTWARHGAPEPMFGVSFAELGKIAKQIDGDHELALGLWKTGNTDARQLAVMIDDSSKSTEAQVDGWLREVGWGATADALAGLVAEMPIGRKKADAWRKSPDEKIGRAGWTLVAKLAMRAPDVPESWFADCLAAIQSGIAKAPNRKREAMNSALIAIGGRSEALRKAALAVAAKIGKVEIDHGDTACKTPEAKAYLAKMWSHSKSKGFASPSAQEQARKRPKGSGCAR